ncbi:MAG: DUF262 domain-containing protein [Janthinobacterium lividum]
MLNEIEKIGEENEEDVAMTPNAFPNQAVLWGTDWTTETVINQLKKGNIELNPSFQRRDAWTVDKKSNFIESLFLGLPIPQIILAERREKRGSYIVIDGKQRLLSIRQFYSENNDEYSTLKLKRLEVLKELNNKSYVEIAQTPELSSYLDAFENQAIRTIVIKNWKDEKYLYTVFLRLNTGSLELSPQELRQALHTGPFSDFADNYSLDSAQMMRIFKSDKPDFRMRDIELYLRYLSFKYNIQGYTGNLKIFLDKTWIDLNKEWDAKKDDIIRESNELSNAIDAVYQIFGESGAFRKWSVDSWQGLFNRAVYDVMVYYFSHVNIRDAALEKKENVVSAFKDLCVSDSDFMRAIEATTKSTNNTYYRYAAWGNLLAGILGIEIRVPEITARTKSVTR